MIRVTEYVALDEAFVGRHAIAQLLESRIDGLDVFGETEGDGLFEPLLQHLDRRTIGELGARLKHHHAFQIRKRAGFDVMLEQLLALHEALVCHVTDGGFAKAHRLLRLLLLHVELLVSSNVNERDTVSNIPKVICN